LSKDFFYDKTFWGKKQCVVKVISFIVHLKINYLSCPEGHILLFFIFKLLFSQKKTMMYLILKILTLKVILSLIKSVLPEHGNFTLFGAVLS